LGEVVDESVDASFDLIGSCRVRRRDWTAGVPLAGEVKSTAVGRIRSGTSWQGADRWPVVSWPMFDMVALSEASATERHLLVTVCCMK
jgi:hypothetical protein